MAGRKNFQELRGRLEIERRASTNEIAFECDQDGPERAEQTNVVLSVRRLIPTV
jgi:hypothetical protein